MPASDPRPDSAASDARKYLSPVNGEGSSGNSLSPQPQSIRLSSVRSNSSQDPRALLGTSPPHGSPFPMPRASPSGQIPDSYWEESRNVNMRHLLQGDGSKKDGDTRTQLFVGNLPFRVRWQDLKDLFRKCGTVLRADVALTPDNRSKGFGTVLYANETDAHKAVETYNGFNWQSRILDVRLDQQDPTGAIAIAMASAPPPMSTMPPAWHPGMPMPMMGLPMPMAQLASPGSSHSSVPISQSPSILNAKMAGKNISRPSSSASARRSSNPAAANESSLGKEIKPEDEQSKPSSPSSEKPQAVPMPGFPPNFAPPPGHHFVPVIAMPNGNGPPMYALQPYGYMPNGMMGFYPMPNGVMGGPPHHHQTPPPQQHQQQNRNNHPPAVPPSAYANRHLFVGNLPFNCQWQDLKDLFRSAGNILRADVTLGPDGRSRGFGTVLYATPEDALRAVEMFNGYEFNGRLLKVHFDKYAAHMNGSQSGSPYPQHQQAPAEPLHGLPGAANVLQDLSNRLPTREESESMGLGVDRSPSRNSRDAQATPDQSYAVPPSATTPGDPIYAATHHNPFAMQMIGGHRQGPGPLHFSSPQHFSTGPAALMSPQPGGPSKLPDMHGFNPMSPQTGRISMTPSMPGFSFHPFPQTPPLVPQFLSPGLGPFSPGMPTTATFGAPMPPVNYNPAPGAPVHLVRQPNSANGEFGISNGYFPSLESMMSSINDSAVETSSAQDSPVPAIAEHEQADDSIASAAPTANDSAALSGSDSSLLGADSMLPPMSSLLARRASTNSKVASPALSVGSPPHHARLNSGLRSASHSTENGRAEFRQQQQQPRSVSSNVEDRMHSLNIMQDSSALDDEAGNIAAPVGLNLTTSLTAPSSANNSPVAAGGQTSHISGSKLSVSNADNQATRRKSFETGPRPDLAFGKSIWS